MIVLPMKGLSLKALYGRAFRAPSYRELYMVEYGNTENMANPDLKPEYIQTIEFVAMYAPLDFMKLNANIFSTDITNQIISAEVSGGTMYDNLGKAYYQGVEAGAEVTLLDDMVTAFANYTVMTKAEDKDANVIQSIATHMANYGVNVRVFGYVNVNAALNYMGQRAKPVDYHTGVSVADRKAEDNLGAYQNLNVVLTSINLPVDITVGVYNAMDEKQYNPTFDPGKYYDIKHPGRSIEAKVAYKF